MKLSKVQKYAISYLSSQGKTNDEIGDELNVPVTSVNKYLQSVNPPASDPPPVKSPSASDFMLNKTSSGDKSRGVMIMTQQASMMADSMPKTSNNASKNIFRPKG